MEIKEEDIRLDIFRNGSVGGDVIVRAVHIPTGIVAQSDPIQSQLRAKVDALVKLAEKLEGSTEQI